MSLQERVDSHLKEAMRLDGLYRIDSYWAEPGKGHGDFLFAEIFSGTHRRIVSKSPRILVTPSRTTG